MVFSLTVTGCDNTGSGRNDEVPEASDDDGTTGTGGDAGTGTDTGTGGNPGTGTDTGGTTVSTAGPPVKGVYYFHPDHLGSTSYLTDAAGKVVTRMYYTPYGEKVKSASSGSDIFHHKYTGQVDDGDEAGLMYYNARYYDPMIGRFISADSIIPDAGYSQSFNRYMYVAGNPVNFNDPSGHYWHLPWSEDLTTSNNDPDGRPQDITFNLKGRQKAITGKENESGILGENGLRYLDRAGLHPTAVLHDHFMAGSQNQSTRDKWITFGLVIGLSIGLSFAIGPVVVLGFLAVGVVMGLISVFKGNGIGGMRDEIVSFGTMLPCFIIATPIAAINTVSQGVSKSYHVVKNVAEKVADKTENRYTNTLTNITTQVTGGITGTVTGVGGSIAGAIKRGRFW
jgi:RHS repeat-associated protein